MAPDVPHRYATRVLSESLGKPSLWVIISAPWYKSETMAIAECCMVGILVKIGQLLDAWNAPEVPPDKHAAALYVLSASPVHRHALGRWMPGGTTSPPEEHKLFEPASGLAIFKQLSLAMRPGLAECWRETVGEARS